MKLQLVLNNENNYKKNKQGKGMKLSKKENLFYFRERPGKFYSD